MNDSSSKLEDIRYSQAVEAEADTGSAKVFTVLTTESSYKGSFEEVMEKFGEYGTSDGTSLAVAVTDESGLKDPYEVLEYLSSHLKKIPLVQVSKWLSSKSTAESQTDVSSVSPKTPADSRQTAPATVTVERLRSYE
jgi:hypothetical protein